MRDTIHPILRAGRVRSGPYGSDDSFGLTGAFTVNVPATGRACCIIASTGKGWEAVGLPGEPWEHVSVSVYRSTKYTPTWAEMCYVKYLFWGEEEAVFQFHPPKSACINDHPGCLHLWKPPYPVALPPSLCVGLGDQQQIQSPAAEPVEEEPEDARDAGAVNQGV